MTRTFDLLTARVLIAYFMGATLLPTLSLKMVRHTLISYGSFCAWVYDSLWP